MLKVDLGRLEREHRLSIEEEIPQDAALLQDSGITLAGTLRIEGEAQQAGADVLIRGRFDGNVGMECRRCLREVTVPVEEEFVLLFRAGLDPARAADEDAYALPARGTELDIADAVREQVLLAAPRFAICDDACKGLCPQCGANLNEAGCNCTVASAEPRWAALQNLKLDQGE